MQHGKRKNWRSENELVGYTFPILLVYAGMIVVKCAFFIVELMGFPDFADRTHTGNHILIYEDMVAAGAILGNLFQIFEVNLPGRMIFLAIYGLFGGIFVGCWAMALAEILNVFPIFMRRARIVRYLAVFVVMVALGKESERDCFFGKDGKLYRFISFRIRSSTFFSVLDTCT